MLWLHYFGFLICLVFVGVFFCLDSDYFRKIIGECLFQLAYEITSGDIAPSTFAVVRSGIVFLLCYHYQYALTEHCEVKVLNECGGELRFLQSHAFEQGFVFNEY